MKELVIISGKGGTGKTSVVASFAALAKSVVLVDCDVDAADLHLVITPEIKQREKFSGGRTARVIAEKCTGCGKCFELCRFEAVIESGAVYEIDPVSCEGCSVCSKFCPAGAIVMEEAINGEWFISDTRHGPMVHAKLGIAEENSGKLVSLVRKTARDIAEKEKRELILVDGPPGIGCPVIASVTGADSVLVVTEPTISGEHDTERALELAAFFNTPSAICVNKWDINPEITEQIESKAKNLGATVVGRIRYDRNVTKAQIEKKSVVEFGSEAGEDITEIWQSLNNMEH